MAKYATREEAKARVDELTRQGFRAWVREAANGFYVSAVKGDAKKDAKKAAPTPKKTEAAPSTSSTSSAAPAEKKKEGGAAGVVVAVVLTVAALGGAALAFVKWGRKGPGKLYALDGGRAAG